MVVGKYGWLWRNVNKKVYEWLWRCGWLWRDVDDYGGVCMVVEDDNDRML